MLFPFGGFAPFRQAPEGTEAILLKPISCRHHFYIENVGGGDARAGQSEQPAERGDNSLDV